MKSANRVIILLAHFHTINESTVRHLGILDSYTPYDYTENILAVITVPLFRNGRQPMYRIDGWERKRFRKKEKNEPNKMSPMAGDGAEMGQKNKNKKKRNEEAKSDFRIGGGQMASSHGHM